MREKRLRWFEHIWRSKEQELCKRVMGLKVGRRSTGRSKRQFMNCIEEDLKIKALQVTDAEDRELYEKDRRKIRTSDPNYSGMTAFRKPSFSYSDICIWLRNSYMKCTSWVLNYNRNDVKDLYVAFQSFSFSGNAGARGKESSK